MTHFVELVARMYQILFLKKTLERLKHVEVYP